MSTEAPRPRSEWVVRRAESEWAAETAGLISFLTVVQGSIETLAESWDELDAPARRMLLAMMRRQTAVALDVLKDMQRQLPPALTTLSASNVARRSLAFAPD